MNTVIISPGKVAHAIKDLREGMPGCTCCNIKFVRGNWDVAINNSRHAKTTCKSCIRYMAASVAGGNDAFRRLLGNATNMCADKHPDSCSEITKAKLDAVLQLLKITRRHIIDNPIATAWAASYYEGKGFIGDRNDKDAWALVEKELARMVMPTSILEEQFFKSAPEVSGLVCALTKLLVVKTEMTEMQLIKARTIALTKEIELDGDIEALSIKEADELVDWLRTVLICKHE